MDSPARARPRRQDGDRPLRIAHLSTQRAHYGGEVHLRRLAAGMRERGHLVACAVRPDSQLARRLPADGVPVSPLPLVDWFEPRGMALLRAWLRRERFDVLHAHTPRDYYVAAVATLGLPTACIATRHLLQPIAWAGPKRPLLRRMRVVVAVSDAVRRALLACGAFAPDRIVTIPNGIDTGRSLPSRDGLRRGLGLGGEEPVVGLVGRLAPDKGVDVLIDAVALLRPRWPRLRTFILGDDPAGGGYLEALRRRAVARGLEGTVHFFGYVDDADLACADFDIQVVGSRAEPFGLATLEGMAHAHPVVATDAGGSREILRHGVDGFLVPPGDAAALARQLDRLLADPDLRRRIGAEARRRVESRFPLARVLDRTEAVYRDAAAGRPPRTTRG